MSISIKNNSNTAGKEVVQLFYNDLVPSITPSVKKLCAYQKIELAPQETKTVDFILSKEDFSFINKDLERVTEAGEIELMIKNKKVKINVE